MNAFYIWSSRFYVGLYYRKLRKKEKKPEWVISQSGNPLPIYMNVLLEMKIEDLQWLQVSRANFANCPDSDRIQDILKGAAKLT